MATAEDGRLSYIATIDTSGFDEGAQHIIEQAASVGSSIEEQTKRIDAIMGDMPLMPRIEMPQNLAELEQVATRLSDAFGENQWAIQELEKEYKSLGATIASSGNSEEIETLGKKREAIRQNISLRKELGAEMKKQSAELQNLKQSITQETTATEQASEKKTTLKQRIKELQMAMAEEIEANGENTQKYREMMQELGRLNDIRSDIAQQGNILANDENKFAGIISGVSGLSGAFSAATGVVSLFGDENENLQKIMVRVNAVMSITNGLQAVAQTLNKDSAFMLVTVNGLREKWHKLLAIGRGELVAETAAQAENAVATEANAAAKTANATATAADATATEADAIAKGTDATATAADATATEANAAAHVQDAAAATGDAAATNADTGAKIVNAGAAETGKVANIGLAGAFRMVGAAIKSVPVFGWIIAAVTALVVAVKAFTSASNKASEEVKKKNEELEESRKKYGAAKIELNSYIKRIQDFNGNQRQEKALINELNQKYGEQMGHYNTLAKWKEVLTKKGEDYCRVVLLEARAQQIATKYAEAYTEAQAAQAEITAYMQRGWLEKRWDDLTGEMLDNPIFKAKKAILAMQAYEKELQSIYGEIGNIQSRSNFGGYSAPSTSSSSTPKDKTDKTKPDKKTGTEDKFDEKQMKLTQEEAEKQLAERITEFSRNVDALMGHAITNAMHDGLTKTLQEERQNAKKEIDDLQKQFDEIIKAKIETEKAKFMATEAAQKSKHADVDWANSEVGKRSFEDWKKMLASDEQFKPLFTAFDNLNKKLKENAAATEQQIKRDYADAFTGASGNILFQIEEIRRKYGRAMAEMNKNGVEYDQSALMEQMRKEISPLYEKMFKENFNLSKVTGDMQQMSMQSLEKLFEFLSKEMKRNESLYSPEALENFQKTLDSITAEIERRNPFLALSNSVKNIDNAKAQLKTALNDFKAAEEAYANAKWEAKNYTDNMMKPEDVDETNADQVEKFNAQIEIQKTRLAALGKAYENMRKAQQGVFIATQNLDSSYKKFSTSLRNAGKVITSLGGDAKNLAKIFKGSVADAIEKVVDVTEGVLDATTSIIDSVGELGKNTAKSVSDVANATAEGTKKAATATAVSISTVEKASAVLAIISAAIQAATVIASLFNNDDSQQKKIEALQMQIDQLQWELDNGAAVRIQEKYGSAVERIANEYNRLLAEQLAVVQQTYNAGNAAAMAAQVAQAKNKAWQASVNRIASAYAQMDYTASALLGEDKYNTARSQLQNLAEQQTLIYKQMRAEHKKKDTDYSKIADYKNKIEEIGAQMQQILVEMVNEIVGQSAEDLASTLGDAFWEAAQSGEDAMKNWAKTVDGIVSDIVKRMLITGTLETQIGKIYDKYKNKWYDSNGDFRGVDAVNNSMQDFANDLKQASEEFNVVYNSLSDYLKETIEGDAERNGVQGGITTASQDSVDEMNARLTTIQGHTFSLVQGMTELNLTGNQILARLTGIEGYTSDMSVRLRNIQNDINAISTRGVRITA